jgi:predicted ATPase
VPVASTIDTLPPEIRSEIDRLLIQRVPLDRIVAHLRELYGAAPEAEDLPSRSALGRYAARTKRLRDRLGRSREMAVAVAKELGEAPGSQQMTVLTELVQTHMFDLLMPEDDALPSLDSEQIGHVAKGLKDITTALRGNLAFVTAAEERAAEKAKKAAAKVVDTVGKEHGISAKTLAAIKAGIFGVRAA